MTFEEIARLCKQCINKKMPQRNPTYAQILGVLPAALEKVSHFEILGKEKEQILAIEFHIENDCETLQKSIKYWEGIRVFDTVIHYNQNRSKRRGHLYISCKYSCDIEKICAYICEFIYQVKNRIENITEVLK
jgi:hypothetical protein